jgi:tetratricopeptide (TPR) repeat protein
MASMALEKALRAIVWGGIFALPFVPLIFTGSLFFPYITGKNFAFRLLVEIFFGTWLALALVYPVYRPKRSWLLGAFALFVLVIGIADAQGAYPFKSFWSNFERMEGWVTLAHLFAYFVVAVSMLQSERLWRRFFEVTLGVSGVVSLVALMQLAGALSLGQGGVAGLSARLDATFGNPIYLAVYMLFHVFIAALLIHQSGRERWASGERIAGAIFIALALAVVFSQAGGGSPLAYILLFALAGAAGYLLMRSRAYLLAFLLVLNTAVLFFTGTRGTMLGLIGGGVLAVLLYAWKHGSSRVWKWIGIGAVASIIAASLLWSMRDSNFVRSVGFLDRLATISLSDNTVKARFLNWGIAWKGVVERPLFGWGQENYAIVFDKYYDPRMYAQEPWFDRVHNTVFDWLIAGGFIGLAAYLSLFVAALYALWRPSVERGSTEASTPNVRSEEFTIAERSLLTGLLAAYFFNNIFVFDNITSYILFVSVLAYIAVRASASSALLFSRQFVSPRALAVVTLGAAAIVWGSAWSVNSSALAANRELLAAIAPQKEGISKNLEHFKKAISYGSYGTQEVREQLAQLAARVAGQNVPVEVKQDFLNTAVEEMTLQANASPKDARHPLFLAAVLGAYGNYEPAAQLLQHAHELSPGKQNILFEMGLNAQARGKAQESLAFFKQAYELEPSYRDALLFYIASAIRAGEDALADSLLAPGLADGGYADVRIAGAYVDRGQYDKLIRLWRARIAAEPEDVQARFTLAAAYYAQGDREASIAELEAARAISPESAGQIDTLIEEVRQGTARVQ